MYELTANALKDGDLSSVYINERGRIVFTELSSQYDLFYYMMDIIQDSEVCPELTLLGPPVALDTPPSGLFRNLNSLLRCTILDKNYLIDIYDALYVLTYTTDLWAYPPGLQFPYDLGSISTRTELTPPVDCLVVGQILVELTEQAAAWEVRHNNGDSMSVLPVCRYDRGEYLCILPADFTVQWITYHTLFVCRSKPSSCDIP